ncbi:MAG: PASTA domain-containing protein [Nitrospirales bacterium]|nr:PASTA domain-containing protein [Nitrospirales bacterium]
MSLIFGTLTTTYSWGFQERWENATTGTYVPLGDPKFTLIDSDEGRWLVGDTVSEFPECGPTPHRAEIIASGGGKALRLTSENSNSDCVDNIAVSYLSKLPVANNRVIGLNLNTIISFDEIGQLNDPQLSFSPNCISAPCGDTISLLLADNWGNKLAYVMQRAPEEVPNESHSDYREIFLNRDGGRFLRNLYFDFSTIPNFKPFAEKLQIEAIEFRVDSNGSGTIDNLVIEDSSDSSLLTIAKGGKGHGTVTSNAIGINCGSNCTNNFEKGTTVILTATPAEGSIFESWEGCDSQVTNQCTVTLTQDRSVRANFIRQNVFLTVGKSGEGSGTVTGTPAGINCGATCSQGFESGTTVILAATPARGSIFERWEGCEKIDTNRCTVTLTQDRQVSVRFIQPQIEIDSVEFTQAIQESQGLDELKQDGPKVPIIKDKPIAVRVYLKPVEVPIDVRVELTGSLTPGSALSIPLQLKSGCKPEEQRLKSKGKDCQSADFLTLKKPGSSISATIKLFVKRNGREEEQESHRFDFETVQSRQINILPFNICEYEGTEPSESDTLKFDSEKCGDGGKLQELVQHLGQSSPTHLINLLNRPAKSRGNLWVKNRSTATDINTWWEEVVRKMERNRWDKTGQVDSFYFYGIARSPSPKVIERSGMSFWDEKTKSIGHSAASNSSVFRFNKEKADEIVSHEIGHLLGLTHTGVKVKKDTQYPGCYETAPVGEKKEWPFQDNTIQEVGFNVIQKMALNPKETFDIMSYCIPQWVSPFTYNKILDTLRYPTSQPAKIRKSEVRIEGSFWLISGQIIDNNIAIDPLFVVEAKGPTLPANGSFQIEIFDKFDNLLETHFFNPLELTGETAAGGDNGQKRQTFVELVPFWDDAVKLQIKNQAGHLLRSINLKENVPTVTILFPQGGESLKNTQKLAWQVEDFDSEDHYYQVEYSPDDGVSWILLSDHKNAREMMVNFDELPGSLTEGSSRIKILTSDGVNTGTSLSNSFSVPKKLPEVSIILPTNGSVVPSSGSIWLQGEGYDQENGFLEDSLLTWESDQDGVLGKGALLPISSLSVGRHQITLSAADRDGELASDFVTINVGDSGPVPMVVGLSQSSAKATIVSEGFTIGILKFQNSDSVPAGSVISQNPLPGTSVEFGGSVDLVVSSGSASPGTPINHAPSVTIGASQTITLPASTTLHGSVTDDGLPNPPGVVTTIWSLVSGPDGVAFSHPNAVDTSVNFSTAGRYVLRLTATDGALITSADLTIIVKNEGVRNVPNDLNGDGTADLLWRNSGSGVVVAWLMEDAAITSTGVLGGVSSNWKIMGMGDVNADHHADVIWRNMNTGAVAVWLMNGLTRTSTGFPGIAPLSYVIKGIGDVDGNGTADLVWQNTVSGATAIWLLNGATLASSGFPGSVPLQWEIAGLGDVDADEKADVIWRNTNTGAVAIWLMNGLTRRSTGFPGNAPLSYVIKEIGDVDGNGTADLVWHNTLNGAVVIWIMNGTKLAFAGFPGGVPLEWQITGIGDMNADGQDDVIWQNKANGAVALWLMKGREVMDTKFTRGTSTDWEIQ